MEEEKYWGYRHVNGTIKIKRYFSDDDLIDAAESPFVDRVIPMFTARNQEEATLILVRRLEESDAIWEKAKIREADSGGTKTDQT